MTTTQSGGRRIFAQALLCLAVIFAPVPAPAADEAPGSSRPVACNEIADPVERLACFDRLSVETTDARAVELTFMEKQWDLNPQKRQRAFVLVQHRPNYFLTMAYNNSPNRDTALEYDADASAQYSEAKFQLSLKAKAFEDIHLLGQDFDFWVAYTQLSFWQVYNSAFSSPFRDTNYEPEALLNWRTQYEIPGLQGLKLQYVNLGFNHQSNGRSRPLSRSWNRLVANFGLEKEKFNLLLKTWYRLPEDENSDDNPDISSYLGYGELWATYFSFKHTRFSVMLRNNLRHENRGAAQFDFSIPLGELWEPLGRKFALYVQYFNGYGEGLLDYDDSVNRISAGFMIVDWL